MPLISPLIVLGSEQIKSMGELERLSIKVIVYFEVVIILIIVMSLLLASFTHTGVGVDLLGGKKDALDSISGTKIDFIELILHLIPSNILISFSEGNLLVTVYFNVFFELALRSLKGKA